LIAGNPPEKRVARLREFWEIVSTAPFGVGCLPSIEIKDEFTHRWVNQLSSLGTLLGGAPGFFKPRVPPPLPSTRGSPDALSYYDAAPLRASLERLVDFDLLNSGITRFSVGAVNVRTANLVYFDNTKHDIGPEHIMASGSLPPGLPATEIDGEHYWDGGLVSNTPLEWVLLGAPRQDTLAFQIDLWSASGKLPGKRQKDIRFSSRTRAAINQFKRVQLWRRATHYLLERLPEELRQLPQANLLAGEADEKVYNIINLIYHTKNYEGVSQDYEFSRRTMEEHWQSGYNDAVRTLRHPEVLQRPENHEGVFTFDLARDGRE
jgi:NTE family protein